MEKHVYPVLASKWVILPIFKYIQNPPVLKTNISYIRFLPVEVR